VLSWPATPSELTSPASTTTSGRCSASKEVWAPSCDVGKRKNPEHATRWMIRSTHATAPMGGGSRPLSPSTLQPGQVIDLTIRNADLHMREVKSNGTARDALHLDTHSPHAKSRLSAPRSLRTLVLHGV